MRDIFCIARLSSCDLVFLSRALLIARKLKAKQGKVEESSVDKVAEKVTTVLSHPTTSDLSIFFLTPGAS